MPGEYHEQRNLAGYSQWDLKESDTTAATEHTRRASRTGTRIPVAAAWGTRKKKSELQNQFAIVLFARRGKNKSQEEMNPECSLEGLMLKLQYFGHLMRRANSGKNPDAGKGQGQEEKRVTED